MLKGRGKTDERIKKEVVREGIIIGGLFLFMSFCCGEWGKPSIMSPLQRVCWFTERTRKTSMSWLMIRSMKGVRRASRVESTDGWYSNGAKNLFGSDGA